MRVQPLAADTLAGILYMYVGAAHFWQASLGYKLCEDRLSLLSVHCRY